MLYPLSYQGARCSLTQSSGTVGDRSTGVPAARPFTERRGWTHRVADRPPSGATTLTPSVGPGAREAYEQWNFDPAGHFFPHSRVGRTDPDTPEERV